MKWPDLNYAWNIEFGLDGNYNMQWVVLTKEKSPAEAEKRLLRSWSTGNWRQWEIGQVTFLGRILGDFDSV